MGSLFAHQENDMTKTAFASNPKNVSVVTPTWAIYSYDRATATNTGWFDRIRECWTHDRTPACEFADPNDAHVRAARMSLPTEQIRIFRSDSGPNGSTASLAVKLNESARTLAFGDMVRWADPKKGDPTRKGMLVITDQIVLDKPTIEYAVNGNAWFRRDEVVLVARATEESINEAFKYAGDNEEDDGLGEYSDDPDDFPTKAEDLSRLILDDTKPNPQEDWS